MAVAKPHLNLSHQCHCTKQRNYRCDASLRCCGVQLEWTTNGIKLNLGSSRLQKTLTIQKASVLTYNGTSFWCIYGGESFSGVHVPTAFIIVYGIFCWLANYTYIKQVFLFFLLPNLAHLCANLAQHVEIAHLGLVMALCYIVYHTPVNRFLKKISSRTQRDVEIGG